MYCARQLMRKYIFFFFFFVVPLPPASNEGDGERCVGGADGRLDNHVRAAERGSLEKKHCMSCEPVGYHDCQGSRQNTALFIHSFARFRR